MKHQKFLVDLTKMYYGEPKMVDRRKNPVAWCTSMAPVEILRAFDVLPLYPENHSALIGSRKMGVELAEVAENIGYSTDICSYARADIGQIMTGKSPVGGLAKPDFLVCCNNICTTVVKWYENLARHFNVPLYLIDTPFNHGSGSSPNAVSYVKGQLEEFIDWLEQVTGKKLSMERLQEVAAISSETSKVWRQVLELNKHKPAPITAFDAFIYMAPIVTTRGTAEALEFYRLLKQELTERVNKGQGAVPNEKYRLLWNGIPVWYELRRMAELMAKYNANLVCSNYTNAWVLDFDETDLLHSMAEVYTAILINQSFDTKFANFERLAVEYSLDGVIHHSNRSCKPYCFGIFDLSKMGHESNNPLPDLIFDGDQTDPRNFSWAQFENRFQSFMETLEA
ncbi:MAG: 2-hydroxyacyl-CoA dehydratase family protein [Bacillota bacterium]|nr:2-hydroxyacyl-CoA dehydratase family protein [Bacillota bacterium]